MTKRLRSSIAEHGIETPKTVEHYHSKSQASSSLVERRSDTTDVESSILS